VRINKSLITFTPTSGAGSGTVTSVAMTVPSGVFTVVGTPITTSGTLAVGLVNQLANTVWAGPTTGAEDIPDFRLLVEADIPNLSASKITSGTLGVDRGGTGATTLTGVLFGNGTGAFTGIASTTATQMLRVNSAGTGYEWFTPDYLSNVMTSLGDIIYGNAVGLPVRRSGNITTTKMFLSQTGDGSVSAAPQWSVVTAADVGAITSLTGEATGSGSGAVAVTLTNSAVIGKVLTGLNVTGGNVVATDSILQGFGKLQNQVNGLIGGVMYQGTWNASTNSPSLASSVGTKGYYYVVSVAGSTNLNGVTDWKLGDWAIYNGTTWEKVDNTDAVISVNGFVGAVVLTTTDVAEGTNLYYTEARVDANTNVAANTAARHNALTIGTANGLSLSTQVLSLALASTSVTGALSDTDWNTFNGKQPALSGTGFVKISGTTISYDNSTYYLASNPSAYITLTSLSAGTGISYNNTTGVITSTITQYTDALARAAISLTTTGSSGSSTYNSTTGVLNVPTYTASGLGAVPTTRTITINDVVFDLSANRSWDVGDYGTW
jgi:hypothetical protein